MKHSVVRTGVSEIPNEILSYILSFLPINHLVKAKKVSQKFNQIIIDNYLIEVKWTQLYVPEEFEVAKKPNERIKSLRDHLENLFPIQLIKAFDDIFNFMQTITFFDMKKNFFTEGEKVIKARDRGNLIAINPRLMKGHKYFWGEYETNEFYKNKKMSFIAFCFICPEDDKQRLVSCAFSFEINTKVGKSIGFVQDEYLSEGGHSTAEWEMTSENFFSLFKALNKTGQAKVNTEFSRREGELIISITDQTDNEKGSKLASKP